MNIDENYIKEIIIPLMTLLLPVLISVIKWWFSRWSKGQDNRRNHRFDAVSADKRISVLAHIERLRAKPQEGITQLQIKALYESIGIRLPVWIAHQLTEYLGKAPLPLTSPILNSFLRHVLLCVVKNGVFSFSAERWKRQRRGLVGFLILSLAAIAYGFFVTVPPLGMSAPSAGNTFWFFFFLLTYLAMAIFVVAWSIDEWVSLNGAKAFWLIWQPNLCQQEEEYQARCRHQQEQAVKEHVDSAFIPLSESDVCEKPLRSWLLRRLGGRKAAVNI